ncbi:CDP-glycerol glycerophosphotransferase family protein [Prevotella sp.]|jgi:CDP-ribitol ribitolphosphotransferase / teichoic acid ribitol-phosphate polymerase|uniref:CDP-glycerol glycerophosphotransferase family protein n=1 Tax=Prevotella sp. TaxID=59823 RepID=UPI0025F616F6|nr:CDP-glycerol glycerophosphotransferase family protein [Prevotella sp.]
MRILLFCENRYAIDILNPLQEYVTDNNLPHEVMWYIHKPKISTFEYASKVRWTNSIQEAYDFSPEAVFVPGNIVPYYLPGVKIQVFHGYAAEKKDHWIIRRYFDTYFTQGPYFTSHFKALSEEYGDFEVVETGWPKQDWIKRNLHTYDAERQRLLDSTGRKSIILYAPTFSPKLTSLPLEGMKERLGELAEHNDALVVMKFHPLTRKEWADEYRAWAESKDNVIFVNQGENITKYQLMSDVLISDTSSTVYEFLLLSRPVITVRTIAKDIYWENTATPDGLEEAYRRAMNDPEAIARRQWIVDNYDPYLDGHVCERMLNAAADYIRRHGVPSKRRLNLWRKYTSVKTFGFVKKR